MQAKQAKNSSPKKSQKQKVQEVISKNNSESSTKSPKKSLKDKQTPKNSKKEESSDKKSSKAISKSPKSEKNKKSESPKKTMKKKVEVSDSESKKKKNTSTQNVSKDKKRKSSLQKQQSYPQIDPDKKFELSDVIQKVYPKKAMTAYLFFSIQKRKEIQLSNPEKKITEVSKMIAEIWKSLKDEEKQPFTLLAEQDKKRLNDEMEQFEKSGFFINQEGVKNTDLMLSKPKFHESVIVPKIVRTPYIYFFKEQYDQVKQKFPTLKAHEHAVKISELWKSISDAEKTKYFKLNLLDKSRYENEMQQLLTQGYFIDEEGKKSTDQKKRQKKSFDDSKLTMSQSTKSGTTFGAEQALSQSSSVKSIKIGQKRSNNISSSSEKIQSKKKLKKQ